MTTTPIRQPSPSTDDVIDARLDRRRSRGNSRPTHVDRARPLEVSPPAERQGPGRGYQRRVNEVDATSVRQPSVSLVDGQQPAALLLTIDQAAKQLSIGRSKLYELIRSGHLATVHIDRIARIAVSDLADYVDRLRLQAEAANMSPRRERALG